MSRRAVRLDEARRWERDDGWSSRNGWSTEEIPGLLARKDSHRQDLYTSSRLQRTGAAGGVSEGWDEEGSFANEGFYELQANRDPRKQSGGRHPLDVRRRRERRQPRTEGCGSRVFRCRCILDPED